MAEFTLYARASVVNRKDVDSDGNPVGKTRRVALPGKALGSIDIADGVSARQLAQAVESGQIMLVAEVSGTVEKKEPEPVAEKAAEAPAAPEKKAKKKASTKAAE